MPVTVPTQWPAHNSLEAHTNEYPCRVAVFGRRSWRRRGQKSPEQTPPIPAFRATMDCTPWVLDGLWPVELNTGGPETTPVADYLKRDLQRIADSANQRLRVIAGAGLDEETRRAEESRVFNVARAFAVLRVESTVRQLRREPIGFEPTADALPPAVVDAEVDTAAPPPREPAPPGESGRHARPERTPEPGPDAPPAAPAEPEPQPEPQREPEPEPQPQPELESERQRLLRLLRSIARQEPGLRWAAALGDDGAPAGTPVVTTDLAHGWIPPGVELPEGVELLAPGRRTGSAADMVAGMRSVVTYTPGDPFGGVPEQERVAGSARPRRVDPIDDLPRRLADATQHRRGLPRLVHETLMTAAAGRVPEARVHLLRVHLDTARYQLLAQYPNLDQALLLNCLLLAAAEAAVTGDATAAGYHFAWFRVLDGEVAEPRSTTPRGAAVGHPE